MGKQGSLSQIPHSLQKASPDPCQLEQMAESKSKEELIRAMRDVAWSENFMPEGNLTFTTLFSQQEYTGSKNQLNWSLSLRRSNRLSTCEWNRSLGCDFMVLLWCHWFDGHSGALSWLVKLQVWDPVLFLCCTWTTQGPQPFGTASQGVRGEGVEWLLGDGR